MTTWEGVIFELTNASQGDYSVRVEALPDSEIQKEVMQVVRSMFNNVTVPEPLDFFFPRWHTNPLFRGSYSNWPPSFSSQHLDNLRANVGRLFFAGEATSRKYFGESMFLWVISVRLTPEGRLLAWCLLRRAGYRHSCGRLRKKRKLYGSGALRPGRQRISVWE